MTYRTGALRMAHNGWDKNDPHGIYFSGTAASNTTISGASGTFTTGTTMTANAYQGMQVRNDNPRRRVTCTRPILMTIPPQRLPITTAVQAGVPRLCSIAVTHFLSARCLIALDQNGRGKGDLISSSSGPRDWPNQQQETCFSWNNKNTDTDQVYGINTSIPTQHEGSDYINLGAGLPANQIPAQVTAAYPASVNGGSAYDHEYPYPHHLVTGGPSPTPTPTPSPTPTPTATATDATLPLRPPLPQPLQPQQRRHSRPRLPQPQHLLQRQHRAYRDSDTDADAYSNAYSG